MRCVHNLVESFHQSFYYYLLVRRNTPSLVSSEPESVVRDALRLDWHLHDLARPRRCSPATLCTIRKFLFFSWNSATIPGNLPPCPAQLLYLFYFARPTGLAHAVLVGVATHLGALISFLSAPFFFAPLEAAEDIQGLLPSGLELVRQSLSLNCFCFLAQQRSNFIQMCCDPLATA